MAGGLGVEGYVDSIQANLEALVHAVQAVHDASPEASS